MNDRVLDNTTADSWDRKNWATDDEWVRAAADLEAETGVDFLIGADLDNNLDVSDRVDLRRLSSVIEDGLTDLLSPAQLTMLVAETRAYINDQVARLKCDQ